MIDKMVDALARLGSTHVVAFRGHDGLDELSTARSSAVVELRDGKVRKWELDPASLGFAPPEEGAIAGGSADENAAMVRDVLDGSKGPRRDIVVLNAAAGLVAAGHAVDMNEGVARAGDALDSGAGKQALERLVTVSNEAAA